MNEMEKLSLIKNFQLFSCPHCKEDSVAMPELRQLKTEPRKYNTLKRIKWSTEQIESIRQMRAEGVQVSAIADKMGIVSKKIYALIGNKKL